MNSVRKKVNFFLLSLIILSIGYLSYRHSNATITEILIVFILIFNLSLYNLNFFLIKKNNELMDINDVYIPNSTVRLKYFISFIFISLLFPVNIYFFIKHYMTKVDKKIEYIDITLKNFKKILLILMLIPFVLFMITWITETKHHDFYFYPLGKCIAFGSYPPFEKNYECKDMQDKALLKYMYLEVRNLIKDNDTINYVDDLFNKNPNEIENMLYDVPEFILDELQRILDAKNLIIMVIEAILLICTYIFAFYLTYFVILNMANTYFCILRKYFDFYINNTNH